MKPEPCDDGFTQDYWDKLTMDALEMLRRIMNSTPDQELKFRTAKAILEITLPEPETF